LQARRRNGVRTVLIEDPTRLARKLPTPARGGCKPILRGRLGLGAGASAALIE